MVVLPLDEQAQLTTLLTQPHRKYHNVNHINDCLVELEQYNEANIADYSFITTVYVTYAIWYHDAIYNPYSKHNEELSARLFMRNAKQSFSPVLKDTYGIDDTTSYIAVYHTIMATSAHTVTQEVVHSKDWIDTAFGRAYKLMLDIDLAGLGKSWLVFKKNSNNIREEYYNTSRVDFIKGRLKFWEEISKRESFYYTEYFRSKYELEARQNIAIEVEQLTSELQNLQFQLPRR